MKYRRVVNVIRAGATGAAIAAVAGVAIGADGLDVGGSEPGKGAADASWQSAGDAERAAIRATFMSGDDQPARKSSEAGAAREIVQRGWDRAKPRIPAELRSAELPSFYLYDGQPVRMNVDTSRIAVKFAGLQPFGEDAPLKIALAKVGVNAKATSAPGIGNWRIITLDAPLGDPGAVNAVIELLLTDPSFEFVSPVFDHATIEGGYYLVTPEVNIRVCEAAADGADQIIERAAKGFARLDGELGGLKGARQVRSLDRNGFRVLKAANELCFDEQIAWAEPDAVSTMDMHYAPNDDFWGFGSMWGWEQANDIDTDAESAWDLTRGNPAVRVLVMDVGVEQDHPDINQLAGRDFTTGAAGGIAGGGPGTGCDRHGTSVASIISGRINNGMGGAGVAPNCRTLSARTAVEQTSPCSSSYSAFSGSWLANALEWGENQGCRISNSSFGVGESSTVTDAFDAKEAGGMIHFASAGNGGADNIGDPTLGYPARLSSVQAVAAIDSDGGRSSFSNWGEFLQFACPGTNVRSADRQGTLGYNSSAGTDGDYTTFGGTSAASPFCAGICALVWGAFPEWQPASILSLMRTSSRDLGPAGYEFGYGWGLPNADFALRFPGPNHMWCDEAVTISADVYNPSPFSTGGANAANDELQENCEVSDVGVGHSVWYRFVPPCSGTISINTNGSSYDTVLAIFRGTCVSATQVGCDDDGGTDTQSQIVDLSVIAGQTYLIKVSQWGTTGSGGTLDFNFEYNATPPANDSCSDATNISITPWTSSRCTRGATSAVCDNSETCEVNGVGVSKSVWWEFTAPSNGKADADTNGSAYDTVMSFWGGCGIGLFFNGQITCLGSTQIACDDDGGTDTDSMISGVSIRKGATLRIKVGAYGSTGLGGDLDFHFNFRPCPADHNLSGSVSVQDIFDYLADYFAGDLSADYNNSGTVTVQDIFDYLALYFAGQCL